MWENGLIGVGRTFEELFITLRTFSRLWFIASSLSENDAKNKTVYSETKFKVRRNLTFLIQRILSKNFQ